MAPRLSRETRIEIRRDSDLAAVESRTRRTRMAYVLAGSDQTLAEEWVNSGIARPCPLGRIGTGRPVKSSR